MPIVARERREAALETMAATHDRIHATMRELDALQAEQEDLETTLGLAADSDVETRESYRVMHFPEGAKGEGHSLDRCPDLGCETADTAALEDALGGDVEDEEETPSGNSHNT
jgi:hypothetical protein